MYTIKKCSEVLDSQIYKAFTDGFSDYMIQVKMDEDIFIKKFFGHEGNNRELSFIAFRNHQPVGITLGGIKTNESFKTLRCGGMSVIPEERGKGLANTLMEYHQNEAIKIGCKQLFLEVIDTNDRAIKFYKNLGYEKVYNLSYRVWNLSDTNPLNINEFSPKHNVELLSYDDVLKLREIDYSHLPWQGDFPYFKKLKCNYYGIINNNKIVAGIAATKSRVFYLWVTLTKRQKGYARSLLNRVITDLSPEALHFSYANNSLVHTFANHYKMDKETYSQFEMYKWLG